MKETDPSRGTMPACARTAELFRSLRGAWTFERDLGAFGSMRGAAKFDALDPHTLSYREDGEVLLPTGASNAAFREFSYSLEDDAIVVRLVDGPTAGAVLFRLEPVFAGLDPWPSTAEGEHPCRDDLYRSRYVFESPDRFRTTIRIDGPAKSFTIETDFRRGQTLRS